MVFLAGCDNAGTFISPAQAQVAATSTQCPNVGNDKCRVEILVKLTNKNRCTFKNANAADAANITFVGAKSNVKMVWVLKTDQANKDFQFCPSAGDGSFLKETEGATPQFSEMGTSNNDNGDLDPNPAMDCKARFRWKNKNANTETYDYMLRFREMNSGTVCYIDPWIKNG